MDLHSQLILDQYKENIKSFKTIEKIVKKELESYVQDFGFLVNSVETRIKTYDSLKGKLELKGYKYQTLKDITDIIGGRVVTFYNDQVELFAAKIEANFDIDWENSVDKRKILKLDQFGYLSRHYICRIPTKMYFDPEHPEINEFRFEIQLRSILQHTWASIHHDTGYKNDIEVPRDILRALNRLAGLLELADDAFSSIRNQLEDYRRRVKQIVKSGDFESVDLDFDSYNAYLDNGGFSEINKKIATINNMEIEQASLRVFFEVFKSLGFRTLKDLDDFAKNNFYLAYEFAVRQFAGKDVDIITETTGPLTLCIVYILSQDMGVNIIKLLLDTVYGPRKNNEKLAEKYTAIGKSMGLGIHTSGDEQHE